MSEAASLSESVVLAERDAAILDFEDNWFTAAVPKEQAIMEHFSLSSARYYQHLNQLIDTPEALAYKPCSSSGYAGCAPSARRPDPRDACTPDPHLALNIRAMVRRSGCRGFSE
ncbi:DUF3263 domain-containing protein [Tessaracoccus coleopterorum]|uniref:DUF3263 domain-containing protein n=1 Tax=Tessaracoccus coleopterorum TaxID=2714950 RepID=UPI002F91457E